MGVKPIKLPFLCFKIYKKFTKNLLTLKTKFLVKY